MNGSRYGQYGLVLLSMVCLLFSGCALLQIPFQLVSAALKIASQLPMPPPGVF